STEIDEMLQEINTFLLEKNIDLKENKIKDILKDKNMSKSEKRDELMKCYDYDKTDKQLLKNVLSAILGYSFDITKIFEIELEKNEEIKEMLEGEEQIYETLKTIYSWYVLQDILQGKKYISEAFIDKYEKYKEDLELLKNIYKRYFKDEYTKMFRRIGKDNYV